MPRFMVKRHLPGITEDALEAAGLRAKTCCEEMEAEGTDVRWVRSFFLPEEEKTFCVFDGPDRETIAEANRRAQIPFEEIRRAMEMTADSI